MSLAKLRALLSPKKIDFCEKCKGYFTKIAVKKHLSQTSDLSTFLPYILNQFITGGILLYSSTIPT